jgi:hypothetical protein
MLVSIALVLAGAGGAAAQTVPNVLAEAGLLGLWANDCRRPASSNNVHTIYEIEASGLAALRYDSGPGYRPLRYTITSARIEAPGRIVYVHVNRDTGVEITVTLAMTGNQIRVWHSRRSTGETLVASGKFTARGGDSPLQTRCN